MPGDEDLADRILAKGFLRASDVEDTGVASPVFDEDRYELLGRLGDGASGEVWKARDRELDRVVALKRIRIEAGASAAETLARFKQEALALAALRHEGIPAVYDARSTPRGAFVVMEYVDGRPFSEVLKEGLHSLEERVAIVEQVARIVHFAHGHGFVHRDLKPSNVVVARDGRPRVIDFGIAKHLGGTARITQTGELLGTPHFMSPEQALGRSAEVTPRSDVFSLGAILYLAVSGKLPFDGPSLMSVARAVVECAPPPLGESAPAALAAAIRRAMEKEPARRHATALAFAEELRAWRAPREGRRWRPVLVGAAAALPAVLGVALALGRAPEPPSTAPAPREPTRLVPVPVVRPAADPAPPETSLAEPAPPSTAEPTPPSPPAPVNSRGRPDVTTADVARIESKLGALRERVAARGADALDVLDETIRALEAAGQR